MTTLGALATPFVLGACYGAAMSRMAPNDIDGDGVPENLDCDDSNKGVHPAADEICDDKIDNDCDGLTDRDDAECSERGPSPDKDDKG